jgi:hypothetical protein
MEQKLPIDVAEDSDIDSETCGPYHVLLMGRARGVDCMIERFPMRVLFFWDMMLCGWVVSS